MYTPTQQGTVNLLRAGVADGYNLPPVPLMIATRGQVLHSADKNTLILQQALGSHRNNMEVVNAQLVLKNTVLNKHAVLSSPSFSFSRQLMNLYCLFKHVCNCE